MLDLFALIYDYFHKRKWLCWSLFFASFALWIFLAFQIKLKQDVSDMLPDSKAIKAMNDVIGKTKASEQVIFLVSFNDSTLTNEDSLISATESFNTIISEKCNGYIDSIILQPANNTNTEALLELIKEKLPLFLSEEDYKKIGTLTEDSAIINTLKEDRKILLSPAGVVMKQFIAQDPLGISSLALKKLSSLQIDSSYEVYDGYLFSNGGRQLSFFLKPHYAASNTGKNTVFFKNVDEAILNWQSEHPDMTIQYFGGAAVAAGNASQLQTDTIITLSVTILLLLALTYYFFRRKRTPLLLFVPVIYGAAMGMGIVYLFQGSISVIALGAGALVLGIAIDFSIHFLSHARHAKDIRSTVSDMSHPLTIGSFTTIAAFLSLQFVNTPILQDLGLFAGASLAGAAFCTLIFLPHFPLGIQKNKPVHTVFDKLGHWQPEKNKWLIIGIVLLTPILFYFAKDVAFDSDLMHLNYLSPTLKKAQDEISKTNAGALSAIYVMAKGTTDKEALQNLESASDKINTAIANYNLRGVSNPSVLLPSQKEQEKRIALWNKFWTKERKEKTIANIQKAAPEAGFQQEAFVGFKHSLLENYTALNEEETAILRSFYPTGFSINGEQHFAIASLRVTKNNRDSVFKLFENNQHVLATDRQQGATQLIDILKNDFNRIALYSSFIVFFALLVGYGRFELAIISFLPMIISWIWILGIMSLLDLKFNIVNIIISSLIFGLGDDFAIFTMDGLVEKYKSGKNKLSDTRTAVYISVLTVIIGLGVLLLAKHPALRSIAFISVTGLLCVLFISQTLQPFLFNWFIQNRANKKYLPFTLWSFSKSVFSFAYFFTGSFILTIAGLILTKLRPFGKERSIYFFHKFLSAYTWSLMHIMRNVKIREYNKTQNDFSKPAVYIANHGSFLDILCTTMLHPRLILLTNKWTWRSPVFGAVVRMAEYYPVAEGAEDSLEKLQDLVARGYSILVFPEGRRSYDDSVKRFHKGAFYISEKLKLDIVPLILHGIQYTMQKGDWLLKDGQCSIYFYPIIAYNDTNFGNDYSTKTKQINKWFREEYAKIKQQNETPIYFREQLLRTYTYKGPNLEWYCRIKTKLENNYGVFHSIIPSKGTFYDLGCGYGFLSYMLHWAAPERNFIGIDYDDEKIEIAQNNMLKDNQIHFEHADITQYELKNCDGIIINDVLHYLLPEQQINVLNKCYNALNDEGILIIRDGISELKDRIKGTELTEFWSTKLLKFNKTENDLHFIKKSTLENFAAERNMKIEMLDMSKFTANLTFILRKKK